MKQYSETIINAFAMYTRTKDLITATGLCQNTIVRYKKDKRLLELAKERRHQVVQEAVYKMQSELTKSVEVLAEIRDNEETNPQTRAYCCNLILNHCREWTLSAEIIERVEALEKAAEER